MDTLFLLKIMKAAFCVLALFCAVDFVIAAHNFKKAVKEMKEIKIE
jgi:hypothetical protein